MGSSAQHCIIYGTIVVVAAHPSPKPTWGLGASCRNGDPCHRHHRGPVVRRETCTALVTCGVIVSSLKGWDKAERSLRHAGNVHHRRRWQHQGEVSRSCHYSTFHLLRVECSHRPLLLQRDTCIDKLGVAAIYRRQDSTTKKKRVQTTRPRLRGQP